MMFYTKCFLLLVLPLTCSLALPTYFQDELLEKVRTTHDKPSCPCEFHPSKSYDSSTCPSGCESFRATDEDTGAIGMTCCKLLNPPSFSGRFNTGKAPAEAVDSVRLHDNFNVAKEMSGKIKLRFSGAKKGTTSVSTRGTCVYYEECYCDSSVCLCFWTLICAWSSSWASESACGNL